MADSIEITIDDKAVQAAFARLRDLANDMTPVMRKAAGHLADATEDAFQRERSPEGVSWVDLAESTKEKRARHGHWPGQILQVSGALASSVTTDYGDDFAEIGSNVPYARIQQLGGQAGHGHKVTIPARPFLGLSEETTDAIMDDVSDALARAFDGH